ncbi:hypothetical protein [Citrobacter koseri]|uniref:hypothetical protein n=1 Tax=Citrobacter koseri TaxID=545 RepID=UPI003EE152D8
MSCWPVHRALCRMAADALSGLRIVLCLAGLCIGRCAGWRLTPYPAYGLWCVLLACASGVVPDGGYALSGLRIGGCFAGLCIGRCAGWRLTPYPAYVL